MSNLRQKLSQGETIRKVRALEEKTAVAKMAEAERKLADSAANLNQHKDELLTLESRFSDAAQKGVSMAEFMRLDSFKSMQVGALERAEAKRAEAQKHLEVETKQVRQALTKRRVAERYVDILSARYAIESKRKEQKNVDDLVCSRAGRTLH